MQRLLRVLTASLVVSCCAGAASQAAEIEARQWLAAHSSAPVSTDELADLKGANPEAYALVKALLTKQSLGLIKRRPGPASAASPSYEVPEPRPLEPDMLGPAPPAVVAQGVPAKDYYSLPAPAAELPELRPITPTAPPPMPGPPPISSELPPPIYLSSAEAAQAEAPPAIEEPTINVVRFSAAATSSSVSGGHDWLNWKPDQMIENNERMVQNVLGAVAALTHGRHTSHAAEVNEASADVPASHNEAADVSAPQDPQPAAMQTPPVRPPARKAQATKVAEASSTASDKVETAEALPSAADLYLSSDSSATSEAQPHKAQRHEEPSDDSIAGHLPGDVGWSNPYKSVASAVVPASTQENSYLKDIDLGTPPVRLAPRAATDDNPYLKGLDLTGSSAASSTSESNYGVVQRSQLLSSHRLLNSLDWDDDKPTVHSGKPRMDRVAKAPQDSLSGFLSPVKNKKKASPPAMVSKNAYLARLDSTSDSAALAASAASSTMASHIEQGNPYLQSLDDSPSSPSVDSDTEPAAVQASVHPESRDKLADFKWDDEKPSFRSRPVQSRQLSMTSSKVQQKQVQKKQGSKKHVLSGWLGAKSDKAHDLRTQRLQEAVAQRVADAKNPYLKGLDIDSDITKVRKGGSDATTVTVQKRQGNPYMASFD